MDNKNQCDGCLRNLPLEDGIHTTENGELIGCDADRYDQKPALSHGPCKPISDVIGENTKAFTFKDKNRMVSMIKLTDNSYLLYMRAVYSGPEIIRTKRRLSDNTMAAIVKMFMNLNNFNEMKLSADGKLAGFINKHEFKGRLDRDCEICGHPDRHKIHEVV